MQTHETNLTLIYSHLCLDVISSDNVSYSSQGRRGHLIVCVPADREVHREIIAKYFINQIYSDSENGDLSLDLHK